MYIKICYLHGSKALIVITFFNTKQITKEYDNFFINFYMYMEASS